MRKHFFIPLLVGMLALGAAEAFAQSATVVMRNGDRVQAEVRDMSRVFSLRVNGQPRQVPLGDIVLFDFTGNGRDISIAELSKANAANGYVVMKNGETFDASLKDLMGDPLVALFTNGRKVSLGDVARLYVSSVSNVPGFTAQAATVTTPQPMPEAPPSVRDRERSAAPRNARTVVVPSNVQWTNTGFNVSRGQYLRFEPSGEIRLSTNAEDIGRPAGALDGRKAERATIPTIPVGALIGRVGNGQPFSIGDTTMAFDMPESGRLFLGVNDDHVNDNSGNYIVKVWEP